MHFVSLFTGSGPTSRDQVKPMSYSNFGLRVTNSAMIRVILVAITGVALLLPACQSTPLQGNLGRSLGVDTQSAQQLGLLVGDYANSFADAVKHSAVEIETGTTALPVRRAALHWKIKAVPAVYTAASRSDPLFALSDLWVLAIQQRDLFDRDEIAQIFGEGHVIAQDASTVLVERIEQVAGIIVKSPDGLKNLEKFTRQFAAEYPIADLSFVRASLAPFYIKFMEGETNLRRQVAAVRGYADTALGLALVALIHAPDMARWQAELTLLDAETFPIIGRTVETMDVLEGAVVDLRSLAVDMPEFIDVQRDAILRDIERQRVETLREIELLRRAVFVDIGLEREAVLAGLEQQIQLVLDGLRIERETITSQIPAVAERAGQSVLPLTREVIDYAFWRAIQLSVLIAAFIIAAIVILRMTRTRGRQ